MKFHHIGHACLDIEAAIEEYKRLGYRQESDVFYDQLQGVKGLFMVNGLHRIELLADLDERDSMKRAYKAGRIMYHTGYFVKCVQMTADSLRSRGYRMVKSPLPSTAFNGALICFMLSEFGLIELIEDKS